jgi:hypothetical protein
VAIVDFVEMVADAAASGLVVTFLRTMTAKQLESNTPNRLHQNLPGFSVGLPMSKGVNWTATMTFDAGDIHAYGNTLTFLK